MRGGLPYWYPTGSFSLQTSGRIALNCARDHINIHANNFAPCVPLTCTCKCIVLFHHVTAARTQRCIQVEDGEDVASIKIGARTATVCQLAQDGRKTGMK